MQHSLVLNWVRSGETIAKTVTVSAENEINFDVTVPVTSRCRGPATSSSRPRST
jgi:hypothetical protein